MTQCTRKISVKIVAMGKAPFILQSRHEGVKHERHLSTEMRKYGLNSSLIYRFEPRGTVLVSQIYLSSTG